MQPDKETQDYFGMLSADVARAYSVAKSARAKGLDPEPRVDIPVAEDLAARVEGLLSTVFPEILNSGLKEEIRALEAAYGKNDERVALLIGKKASEGAFGKFPTKEKEIEAGLRAAVAYLTLGIVTAPLEGVSDVKIRKNTDGTEYLAVYFAGPIRSAGGTASAMSVLAADFIRKHAGLGEYKPDENEINRYVTEVEDYYTRVTPKQYHPTREEIEMIIKNIPVEITGDPTEKLEVSNYKDLPRVETNRIRGGMCLVLLDGVPLKAEKLLARVKKYPKEYLLENWLWLEKFIVLKHKIHTEKKQETGAKYVPNTKYLSKVIAGRPVISFPAKPGGFRLRYGRARTGGLAAVAIHPATMYLTEFLAVGTQIATELPGKASVCSACDTISPPTVLLKNGDVVELHTKEDAQKFRAQVQKILALGDIIVPFGEFVSNNHVLLPSAYVEEWWVQDVLSAVKEGIALKGAKFMSKPYPAPEFEEAVAISREFGAPLHPKYNFFWHDISVEDVCRLIEWITKAKAAGGANELRAEGAEVKEILETLCVPHNMAQGGEITISESAKSLYFTLGSPTKENKEALAAIARQCPDAISAVSRLSGIKIMMHGPTRVGVKMGRPEKAERRLLKGRPQVLFPCGSEGGRMRNIMDAFKKGEISATLYTAYCPQCRKEVHNVLCPFCRTRTVEKTYCTVCGIECAANFHCNQPTKHYRKGRVDVHALGVTAAKRAGVSELPKIVKGVRGVFGQNRHAEPLEKGFLRAQHDLYVNKDGTTRYDASDMSLSHFRPREIGTSVEKLMALGYLKDMYGTPLESDDQLLELKPQDIIISDNSDFSGAAYLVRIAQFIDGLLERYYGLPRFYNIASKEELIGTLVIGLAPHTSAGIIGRIIGYTPAKVCFAHPFWHAGKRRNCLSPDTEVMVLNSNTPKRTNLEELYNRTVSPEKAVDDFGTLEKKITGRKTFALNPKTGKSEIKEILSVIKTPAPEHLVKVRSKSGREFISSPEHRALVMDNGSPTHKKVFELKAKDTFLVPGKIECIEEDIEELDLLLEFLKLDSKTSRDVMVRGARKAVEACIKRLGGLKICANAVGLKWKAFSNYIYRDSIPLLALADLVNASHLGWGAVPRECKIGFKRNFANIPRMLRLDAKFMRLLGYYISEGYARRMNKMCYQVSMASMEEEMQKDMDACIRNVFEIRPYKSKDGSVLVIPNRAVYHLFVDILKAGSGAKEKRIPQRLANLPKEKMNELLKAYFSGDGSVEKGVLHVTCSSASKALLRDIGLQLLRFGIFYRLKSETRAASGAAKKFYDKKGESPIFTLNYISIRSVYARQFCEKIGFFLKRKQLALETALAKLKNPRISKFGDFILDEISEIEHIKSSHKYLYDIEVEGHHNFLVNDFLLSANCDGDEDSIMLLLDALLNFSREFLPDKRGGRSMDAPLVLTTCLNPEEVDDEAWNVDIDDMYSREFYESTYTFPSPKDAAKKPRLVSSVIRTPGVFHIKFTHDTKDINEGPLKTKYVELASMSDKLDAQLSIAKKLRSVDENKVAEEVLSKHFFRDIKGNARTFSYQKFRCVSCNDKYRRPPLSGRCLSCGGRLLMTVTEGSVKKYIEPSRRIMDSFKVSTYLRQQFALLEDTTDQLFGHKGKQLSLSKFNGR